MRNETNYLSEAEIIRLAEQERSRVIAEFFGRLFHREKRDVAPGQALAAE